MQRLGFAVTEHFDVLLSIDRRALDERLQLAAILNLLTSELHDRRPFHAGLGSRRVGKTSATSTPCPRWAPNFSASSAVAGSRPTPK